MLAKFNNCISIGVEDKEVAAARFVACFEAEITKRGSDWIELTAGPYKLYLTQDGTKDIAFAVDVPKESFEESLSNLSSHGFVIDQEITERTKETFVRDSDGILILADPVSHENKRP